MKSGVLIFAFNNQTTDYVRMAEWNARRINQWLDLPVTLVTDQDIYSDAFDQIIKHQPAETQSLRSNIMGKDAVSWRNLDRCDAFDLTPYHRTLLLDADYVINSCSLGICVHGTTNFLCHTGAWDLATARPLYDLNCFGRFSLPMCWATAVIFSRDADTQDIFECWRMIRDNWQHYRNLYGINEKTFRNDHALTIARSIIQGHVWQGTSIPWYLPTVMPNTTLEHDQITDIFSISYLDKKSNVLRQTLCKQDFHAMNKDHLERCIG